MSTPYCVGIDVALHTHRVGVLGPDGEAVGPSFTIAATQEGFTELVHTLQARGAVPAMTLVGLEATGHYWENLEAFLAQAGYRVLLLNAGTLPAKNGTGQDGQASVDRGRCEVAPYRVRDAQAPGTL